MPKKNIPASQLAIMDLVWLPGGTEPASILSITYREGSLIEVMYIDDELEPDLYEHEDLVTVERDVTLPELLMTTPHMAKWGVTDCGMQVLRVRYDQPLDGFRYYVYRIDQGYNVLTRANTSSKLDGEMVNHGIYDCYDE